MKTRMKVILSGNKNVDRLILERQNKNLVFKCVLHENIQVYK